MFEKCIETEPVQADAWSCVRLETFTSSFTRRCKNGKEESQKENQKESKKEESKEEKVNDR